MIDYKTKIRERWPGRTRLETSNQILKFLDQEDPGWKEWVGTLPADSVLREALGEHQHGLMDLESAEEAERFIMDYYIGEEA